MKELVYIGVLPKATLRALGLEYETVPLGQLVVATTLRNKGYRAIVFSADLTPEAEIIERIKIESEHSSVIVGVSVTAGNSENAFDFTRMIRSYCDKIIAGGPEISMAGPRTLVSHPEIDLLVIGPGESVILDAIEGRSNPRALANATLTLPKHWQPPSAEIDFDNISIQYSLLWNIEKLDGVSYLWGNDCLHAQNRCFFCGRLAMGRGFRKASDVWSELHALYQRGLRKFYNTTDSVTSSERALAHFVASKPKSMAIDTHRVFVNSRDVNLEVVGLLHRLNGIAVMGFESFALFPKANKEGTRIEHNTRALDLLSLGSVPSILSFVIGLPGENESTIEQTLDHIENLLRTYGDNIHAVHISPLLITSGSPAHEKLFQISSIRQKYQHSLYPYSAIRMSVDYFNEFCGISRSHAIHKIATVLPKIHSLAPSLRIGLKGVLAGELDLGESLHTYGCDSQPSLAQ